jgi:3-deoxy-7-phosphoheptulonate synthase
MSDKNNIWTPHSWRDKPISQQPNYPNQDVLKKAEAILSKYPPLVFAGEVNNLKKELSQICNREAFLLQAGDCAETFDNFNANSIRDTLKVILQMAVVMTFASGEPIVKVGRIAGQFAKPRSSDIETIDGVSLPSYRGDMVNGYEFTKEDRTPDPQRMVQCYNQSASTLNFLRSLNRGGFSALEQVHSWNLDFTKNNPSAKEYQRIADNITEKLSFIDACGIHSENTPQLKQVNFYTSHEALLLNYEEALTRRSSLDDKWYDCSAHMVWIGERTRKIDEAHIEFFKGIENPIGMKISDKVDIDELLKVIDILNPNNEAGRLTLIVRMGANKIKDYFPKILKAVIAEGKQVIWSIDPMHGNTYSSSSGYKTRSIVDIITEVKGFFDVHKSQNSYAGGIHLEMTGLDVTECIGGINEITEGDLSRFYQTTCDPRLNCNQSLELAFYLTEILKEQSKLLS